MPSYAELRCKTAFSLLRGASHPQELVGRAGELGLSALAVTDLETLAGAARAHLAAKEVGLPLVVGAEVAPRDGPALVLLAQDRAGYGRLCRLITTGRRRAAKGTCDLLLADVLSHAEGLIAIGTEKGSGVFSARVAPPRGGVVASAEKAPDPFSVLRAAFGDRLYLALEAHRGSDEVAHLRALDRAAAALGIPTVATNDVHYHDR
ncbi:MAG TPA: PHP domain-containing protein, partial [Planctomycetota bacterium]|nr:PHP domain-containing protein [Planctomycetota bacterium]